eukprot:scaffold25694_cov127-Cylindrotheca_fusiformis.AAC.22
MSTVVTANAKSGKPLYSVYTMASTWEFTLKGGEKFSGEIYCTDPISDLVVIREQTDIRMISAASIQESRLLNEAPGDTPKLPSNMAHNKKALEEREKRAIRLAEESLRHLNPKASPKGQIVFDRLLKACNEVVWKGESIIVLKQIQVDPPYAQENCKLLQGGSAQAGGSLDRVQKIVAAAAVQEAAL